MSPATPPVLQRGKSQPVPSHCGKSLPLAQELPKAHVQRSGYQRSAHRARASKKNSPQAWWCDPAARAEKGPGAGMYLMMVCMPRTCGVLSRTLSVFGRGCPWWAEARAALQRGRAQSCAARRATAPGPWRDTTPPKEGSRRTLEGQQRAWPSRLDPEERPMHEISELDYPKRLSEPPGPTHCCCSLCTALASIRPRSSAGQDIPRHPGTWLCTTGGTRAVLLKRDMNCQEQGPCRALLPHK